MKTCSRLIQFAAIIGIIFFFDCQKETPSLDSLLERRIKQFSADDLNAFLLDKITHNKIVMVGDHEHGQGLYSCIVIDFLKYWLDQIEQNKNQNIPCKIILFLEHDSLTNQRLYRFFQSSNLMDFIEPEDFVVDFTVDRVAFLHDLREIHQRIQKRNHSIQSESKIHFQIIGPEKIIELAADSHNIQDIFSIEQRDKYSADQVCRYLATHPDYRALIFYGAGHLFRRNWPKSTPPYYTHTLAYHLTDKYRAHGGCYTIFQYNLRAESRLPRVFNKPNRSYALENQYLEGLKFDLPRFLYDADASFFLNKFGEHAIHISQVPTNNFVSLFLDCLETYLKNPLKPGNEMVIKAAVQYLQMVSGFPQGKIDLDDMEIIQKLLNDWKMWYLQNGFDPIAWTTNYQFLLSPFRLYRQNPDQQNRIQIEQALKKLSGTAPDTVVIDPDEQIRIWLRHLESNRIPVLALRLIQISWVSNENEQQQAFDELTKLTKENFNSSKEWSNWWRKKMELIQRLYN